MFSCVFCDIIRNKTYTDSTLHGVSFEPLNPVTPGHRLFIPRSHVADAASNPFVTAEVMRTASEWASKQGKPFNLITSAGEEATQTVFHLHIHYVPREKGDSLALPWTPQPDWHQLAWEFYEKLA